MENARIVKRNQQLRSLGWGSGIQVRVEEVNMFTFLRWPLSMILSAGRWLWNSLTQCATDPWRIHGGITLPNVDTSPPIDAPANRNLFAATGNRILHLITF